MMLVLSLPFSALAQGGLFQRGDGNTAQNSVLMRSGEVSCSLTNQGFGATNSDITNQTFGVPLGSGLFILFAAGAGYAASKIKQIKQKRD